MPRELSVTKHFDKKEGVWFIRGYTVPIKDALQDGGCEWDAKRICWVYPGEELPQEIINALNGNLNIETAMKPVDLDAARNRYMSGAFRQLAKLLTGKINFAKKQMEKPPYFESFNDLAKKAALKTMSEAKQNWDRLTVLQDQLHALADQWEKGEVAPILHSVSTASLFSQLVTGVQIKQVTVTHDEFNNLFNAANKRDSEVMKTLNALNVRMSKAKSGEITVKPSEMEHVNTALKVAPLSVAPGLRENISLLREIANAHLDKADKWAEAVKAVQGLTAHEISVPVVPEAAAAQPAPDFKTVVRRAHTNGVTPLIQHYRDIKSQYPDALVLFQLGDFYEAFGDDAEKLSTVCDVVLGSRPINRTEKIQMAGIPRHSITTFQAMLSAVGLQVRIAVETDNHCNGQASIVERRVLEPGVQPVIAQPEAEPSLPTV